MSRSGIKAMETGIDRMVTVGTAAAVFALKLAVLRLVITGAVGSYPDIFATPPGMVWWAAFIAAIGIAAASYIAAVALLIRGE